MRSRVWSPRFPLSRSEGVTGLSLSTSKEPFRLVKNPFHHALDQVLFYDYILKCAVIGNCCFPETICSTPNFYYSSATTAVGYNIRLSNLQTVVSSSHKHEYAIQDILIISKDFSKATF